MKADVLSTALRTRGYNVVWAEETEDRLAVGIDFINDARLPWIKAFHLDKEGSDVPAFIREIEDWKKDLRQQLSFGVASDTVRAVISHYGMERLEQAVAVRQ